jgi:hypothetical protein
MATTIVRSRLLVVEGNDEEAFPKEAQPANPAKARAKAFLAAMPESVPHVGLATRRGYWNLDHPSLNELKSFLARL